MRISIYHHKSRFHSQTDFFLPYIFQFNIKKICLDVKIMPPEKLDVKIIPPEKLRLNTAKKNSTNLNMERR